MGNRIIYFMLLVGSRVFVIASILLFILFTQHGTGTESQNVHDTLSGIVGIWFGIPSIILVAGFLQHSALQAGVSC